MRGAKERWLLLSRDGRKTIGRRAMPNSKRTFPNRKTATVVSDSIEFHGARLNVEVLNQHRSRFFRRRDWTVAADRLVRLEEGGVECRLDKHLVIVEMAKHKRGRMPPYSAFVWELPRTALKNFPVMLGHDKRGRFVGLTIFKPQAKDGRRRTTSS